MKIYKIEDGKTVEEIEVTNFTKENRGYCFFVKDCFFKYCTLFWINNYSDINVCNSSTNVCNSRTNVFYSLKRY